MSEAQTLPSTGGRRTRGGAEARRAARGSGTAKQQGFIRRNVPLYEPFTTDQLELIEANAETVLQEIGIDFRDDAEALSMWKAAGADVKGDRVRFPKGLVRALLKTAPREFVQYARNPERSVTVGGNSTIFAPVYGPPFIRNLDEGRRYATIEDFRNFVKLAYMAPSMHSFGRYRLRARRCAGQQAPSRHGLQPYQIFRQTLHGLGDGARTGRRFTIAMAKLVFGDDFVENNCVTLNLINANSPMVFDEHHGWGFEGLCPQQSGDCVVSPFILSGAMSPGDGGRER